MNEEIIEEKLTNIKSTLEKLNEETTQLWTPLVRVN